MPWSQMISTNCMPPRPIEMARPAKLPKVKARWRNRLSWIIGAETRFSMMTNAARSSTPPAISTSTRGLVQPMVWPP